MGCTAITAEGVLVVVQSLSHSPSLCDPIDCSMPSFPVLHHLLEFAQIHVHWVGDAICMQFLFSSVQSLSHIWLFDIPWTAACQASLSTPKSQSLPKLMSVELVMPSNHLILCHPLLLLPSIFPRIRVFSNESVLHIRCPKYWSFSFSISPSSEHSGLISFRMDWLDPLTVQGTLKSLLQHHSSKSSILQRSAFFVVQLSHPYMITGKTVASTRRTFVDRVMSLLFNMLSRLYSLNTRIIPRCFKITLPINQFDEHCFFIPCWPLYSCGCCLMDENFYILIHLTGFHFHFWFCLEGEGSSHSEPYFVTSRMFLTI